jgi:hypothetical protein
VIKDLKRLTAFVIESIDEDTATSLPEVAMRKQIVNLALSLKHDVHDDSWHTCPAATKERDGGECGRDNMRGGPCECHVSEIQARLLTVLASMYADRPGGRDVLITAGRF